MSNKPKWTFSSAEAVRVSRDIAWEQLSAIPAHKAQLQVGRVTRLSGDIDWSENGLAADSLTRTELATAAATWCDAFDSGFSDLFLARKTPQEWGQILLRVRAAAKSNQGHSIVFSSSGTQGAAKHIRHFEANLWQEALGWARLLASRQRVVVCCPVHHIYGFIWGVMLPQALGIPVVDMAWDAPDFSESVRHGDLIVGVPTQWHWWAQSRQIKRWPHANSGGTMGVSSAAALPRQTAQSAYEQGLTQLLSIYGSTETAGIAWCDEIEAVKTPAQQAYFTLGPARQRQLGGDGIQACLADGTTPTLSIQDHIVWHSDSQFQLAGRLDDVVQVGGHNVSLHAVAGILQSHPDVQAAAVRLDATTAIPRLKAFVVLEPNRSPDNFELWLNNLPAYEQPVRIRYGQDLPNKGMSKPTDWE